MSAELCISVLRGVKILLYLNELRLKQVYKTMPSNNVNGDYAYVFSCPSLVTVGTIYVIQVLGRNRDCGVLFESGDLSSATGFSRHFQVEEDAAWFCLYLYECERRRMKLFRK